MSRAPSCSMQVTRRLAVNLCAALLVAASCVDCACLTKSEIRELYGNGDCNRINECTAATENSTDAPCSYQVVNASASQGGFEATELSVEAATFELELSIEANETLVIGLIGYSSKNMNGNCNRFTVCPNSAIDGQRRRLKLRIGLMKDEAYSYALSMAKTTNGMLCQQPRVTLFLPLPSGRKQTGLQLAVQDGSCIATGAVCTVDAYLLRREANSTARLDLKDFASGHVASVLFNSSKTGWQRRAMQGVKISGGDLTVTIDGDRLDQNWRSDGAGDKESCYVNRLASLTVNPECPTPTTAASAATASAEGRPAVASASGSAAVIVAAVAAPAVATVALLWLLLRWGGRCWPWPHRRSVLLVVFPDEEVPRHPAVRWLHRALADAAAFKLGRLRLRELPDGLGKLTPGLAKSCRALLFVSRRADFGDFRLDACRSPDARLALLTVLAEKHRTRGLYLHSGSAPPPPGSPWARLTADRLGGAEAEAVAAASRLLADCCCLGDELA